MRFLNETIYIYMNVYMNETINLEVDKKAGNFGVNNRTKKCVYFLTLVLHI